jgi:hypothetical protein
MGVIYHQDHSRQEIMGYIQEVGIRLWVSRESLVLDEILKDVFIKILLIGVVLRFE